MLPLMNKIDAIKELESIIDSLQTAIINVNAMSQTKISEAHDCAVEKYGPEISAVIRDSLVNTLIFRVPHGRTRPLPADAQKKRTISRRKISQAESIDDPQIEQLRETLQFFQNQNADLFQLLKLALDK